MLARHSWASRLLDPAGPRQLSRRLRTCWNSRWVGVGPHALLHPISLTVSLMLVVIAHPARRDGAQEHRLGRARTLGNAARPGAPAVRQLTRPILADLQLARQHLAADALRVTPRDELDSTVSQAELAVMISDSRDEGLIDDEGHQRLARALASVGRTVADVMIPLADVRCLDAAPGHDIDADRRRGAVAQTGYSRFPVRSASALTGYLPQGRVGVIVDDTRARHHHRRRSDLAPAVLHATTMLDDAMTRLRRTSSHLGTVVDDAGRTIGLVALADRRRSARHRPGRDAPDLSRATATAPTTTVAPANSGRPRPRGTRASTG